MVMAGMVAGKKPKKTTQGGERVALYARVSTLEQDPAAQVDALEGFAARQGYEVVGTYIDHGVSGATLERPQLDQVDQLVEAGAVDLVVVLSLDRLARSSLLELLGLVKRWNDAGAHLVAMRETIDTRRIAGKMLIQLWGTWAEYERERISERTRLGMQKAKRRGKHVGRPREQVSLAAFEALKAKGMKHHEIAAELGVSLSTLQRRLRVLRSEGQKG